MGFQGKKALSRYIPWVIAVCAFSRPLLAQSPSDFDRVATQAAEVVATTHPQRIFIAGLENCLLDVELCASFEAVLRANLEKMVPGAQFVDRQAVISLLASKGFITLDAYMPDVLRSVAPAAAVDTLVTDDLLLQPNGFDLICEVDDMTRQKKFDGIRAAILRTVPPSGGEPLVFTDPDSNTSILIPRGRPSQGPSRQYPACQKCPDPSYTRDARAHRIQGRVVILATITEQGRADRIAVIKGLPDGLTDKAVEAVRSWRFRPGIGKDGKPLAVRVPIEITFRLE